MSPIQKLERSVDSQTVSERSWIWDLERTPFRHFSRG